jgi:hypothetical protein
VVFYSNLVLFAGGAASLICALSAAYSLFTSDSGWRVFAFGLLIIFPLISLANVLLFAFYLFV